MIIIQNSWLSCACHYSAALDKHTCTKHSSTNTITRHTCTCETIEFNHDDIVNSNILHVSILNFRLLLGYPDTTSFGPINASLSSYVHFLLTIRCNVQCFLVHVPTNGCASISEYRNTTRSYLHKCGNVGTAAVFQLTKETQFSIYRCMCKKVVYDNDKQFIFRHVCPYSIKKIYCNNTLCTILKTVMMHQEKTIQIL